MQIVSEHAFQGKHSEKVDYQTLDQAYVNILAGSCLGLGLRYAGTCDIETKHCLVIMRDPSVIRAWNVIIGFKKKIHFLRWFIPIMIYYTIILRFYTIPVCRIMYMSLILHSWNV